VNPEGRFVVLQHNDFKCTDQPNLFISHASWNVMVVRRLYLPGSNATATVPSWLTLCDVAYLFVRLYTWQHGIDLLATSTVTYHSGQIIPFKKIQGWIYRSRKLL
jgi:hypothetical protein